MELELGNWVLALLEGGANHVSVQKTRGAYWLSVWTHKSGVGCNGDAMPKMYQLRETEDGGLLVELACPVVLGLDEEARKC